MTFGIPKYGRKIFGCQFLLNMFIYIIDPFIQTIYFSFLFCRFYLIVFLYPLLQRHINIIFSIFIRNKINFILVIPYLIFCFPVTQGIFQYHFQHAFCRSSCEIFFPGKYSIIRSLQYHFKCFSFPSFFSFVL